MTAGISQMSSLAKCGVKDFDVVINFFYLFMIYNGPIGFSTP